jgi:membrane protein DedA with SNARE-associated domain
VGAARLAMLERAFARRGLLMILCGRFVPGLRATLLVAAGAAGVPLRRLAAADGAAALVGAALWIAVGLQLGPEIDRAHTIVGSARGVVLCLALLVVGALIVRDWRRRHATLTSARSSARDSSPSLRDRASRSRDRATHP